MSQHDIDYFLNRIERLEKRIAILEAKLGDDEDELAETDWDLRDDWLYK